MPMEGEIVSRGVTVKAVLPLSATGVPVAGQRTVTVYAAPPAPDGAFPTTKEP